MFAHSVGSTLVAPLHRTSWGVAMRDASLPGSAVYCSSAVPRIGVANHEATAAARSGA